MRASWILVGVFCLGGCSESGDVFFTSVGSTGSTGTGTASVSSASSTGGGDGGATSSSVSTGGGGGGGGGEGGGDAGTDGPCVPNGETCEDNPPGSCATVDDGCGHTENCNLSCGGDGWLACELSSHTCICSVATGLKPQNTCASFGNGMGKPYYCGSDPNGKHVPAGCEWTGVENGLTTADWIWCCQ